MSTQLLSLHSKSWIAFCLLELLALIARGAAEAQT